MEKEDNNDAQICRQLCPAYENFLPNVGGKTVAEVIQPLYNIATRKIPGRKFVDLWKEQKMDKHYAEAKQLLVMFSLVPNDAYTFPFI